LILAASHPDRIDGAVFIGPATPMGGILPERRIIRFFDEVLPHDESWAKYNICSEARALSTISCPVLEMARSMTLLGLVFLGARRR
jgi:pimeloyl-ACP methyl ester carboxylesterase